ncbi:uncharacterized protein HD556DRAFT_1304069 [Suillus plorans]|uniref:Uncharacterized protein n=1 Tax=Suillus plorans TaxID=116603 RepID=A0A9P7DTT6_9AGAM|nr:uncharacterized protein HD556DRAFT_1304069 [Suillus plorans]KAG1802803.1 hypothetical protein HD556DRAFT_1304069 [Suillus plorans]
MSTPVDTSLTGLKAITAQIMAIVTGARQLPPGSSHYSLTSQVSELVSRTVREYGNGPYIPGLVLLCSKELLRVRGMTPQVWPNWHSIGYDDPRLLKHAWYSKIVAWEALGDHTFDLPVAPGPSVGSIPVDLPSPPIVAGNVAGSSSKATSESREKGKGKAVVANPLFQYEAQLSRATRNMCAHFLCFTMYMHTRFPALERPIAPAIQTHPSTVHQVLYSYPKDQSYTLPRAHPTYAPHSRTLYALARFCTRPVDMVTRFGTALGSAA